MEALQEADEKFLQEMYEGFRAQVREFVGKMRAQDEETISQWKEKVNRKIDVIVLRRLVRLEILFEARDGEQVVEVRDESGVQEIETVASDVVRAEAIRRASDKDPLLKMMETDLDSFKEANAIVVVDLIRNSEDEDRLYKVKLAATDKQFREGLKEWGEDEHQRLVLERDKIRGAQVAKRQAKRLKELREILQETIEHNSKILEEIDNLNIDEIDQAALDGKTLEDYCFDT